ncbi:hypothetical protein Tco_1119152, partial [Tanacetum coccineum]
MMNLLLHTFDSSGIPIKLVGERLHLYLGNTRTHVDWTQLSGATGPFAMIILK